MKWGKQAPPTAPLGGMLSRWRTTSPSRLTYHCVIREQPTDSRASHTSRAPPASLGPQRHHGIDSYRVELW